MPPPTHQSPSALDLSALNDAQAAAVTAPPGPLLILAGPGSGKTRVLAHRIAHLVQEQGVPPWRILAVTFTNKAAREMRDRIETLLPDNTQGLLLGTFHALCVRILRRDGEAVGVPRGFVIYDDDDQIAVVKRILQDLAVDPKTHPPRRLLSAISRAKNEGLSVDAFQTHSRNYFQEIVARAFAPYQDALQRNAALDFDDLLGRTLDLFHTQPDIAARYHERIQHVLVDEFQDTNVVQYRLARAWAAGSGNLTVVGDPDQSIYSWRAADIRNILHFERDFPTATTVRLEQNYRSTKAICRLADAIIAQAPERIHKSLWTDNPEGDRPLVYEAYTEVDEADYVAREIEARVAAGDWRPGDVAVCYRTNAQSRVIEEALLRRGIPYRLIGGTRFYARREIKDLLALCRLVHNPHDDLAFERMVNVPGHGIGQKTRALLLDWADRNNRSLLEAALAAVSLSNAPSPSPMERGPGGEVEAPRVTTRARTSLAQFLDILQQARDLAAPPPQGHGATVAQLIDHLLRHTNYQDYLFREYDDGEDRWNNVQELRTVAGNYDELAAAPGGLANSRPGALPDEDTPPDANAALAAFLTDIALVADVDGMEDGAAPSAAPGGPTRKAVTLITLHAAKGLEFPAVFLTGMEDGLLPHQRSFDDPAAMEEERRLCYVGLTRAQRWLYCLYAFRRALAGQAGHSPPSRYLSDLPDNDVDRRGRAIDTRSGDVRPARNRWLSWDDFDTAPSPAGRTRPAPPSASVRPERAAQARHRTPSRMDPANQRERTAHPDADDAPPAPGSFDGIDPDPDAILGPANVPGEGAQLRHQAFGLGTVLAVRPSGRHDHELTVDFQDAGIKKLLLSLAPLERA